MSDKTARNAYVAAIVGGAIFWLATTAISGRHEAWDSSLYWTVAYPLSIIFGGGLGYWVPDRPWRWGLSVMLGQAVALAVTSSSFGLLPLGLILFAVLALPAIGLARIAARIRMRRENA